MRAENYLAVDCSGKSGFGAKIKAAGADGSDKIISGGGDAQTKFVMSNI
jgi:hypothetical protein